MTRHLLVASAWLFVAWQQWQHVEAPYMAQRWEVHRAVVDGTAWQPLRWRVLLAYPAEWLGQGDPARVLLIHAGIGLLALLALLWGVDAFARLWLSDDRALLAVWIVAAGVITSMVYTTSELHYSYVEAALVTWGMVVLYRIFVDGRRLEPLFAALVILAALNRVTGLVLPVMYGLAVITHGDK